MQHITPFNRDKGCTPATWSQADISVVQFYHQHLYQAHPDLCLWEAEWKSNVLAIEDYPAWYRMQKENVIAIKELAESVDHHEPHPSIHTSKKRGKKLTSNIVCKIRVTQTDPCNQATTAAVKSACKVSVPSQVRRHRLRSAIRVDSHWASTPTLSRPPLPYDTDEMYSLIALVSVDSEKASPLFRHDLMHLPL